MWLTILKLFPTLSDALNLMRPILVTSANSAGTCNSIGYDTNHWKTSFLVETARELRSSETVDELSNILFYLYTFVTFIELFVFTISSP